MPLQQKTGGDKAIKSSPQEIAQARPKTFRRPAGMDDKEQEVLGLVRANVGVTQGEVACGDNAQRMIKNKPAHHLASASDKHFGAILILLLIIMNVMIAYAFSFIKPVSPRQTTSVETFQYKPGYTAGVSVYSTPEPIRRTATYLSLDSAADSTDTMIKQMPAPPPSVEFE